ncbi:AAA family ATPase [Natronoflexus pectinivorans]|uniref:Putative ATPase n=1 Tax=Natronoflexus pectinivorans TaxID=682526 RepID=A0A4R2GKG8_9BACT|nr:AAA family ATPase [Natronoflexus pectinivorans]TCO09314.1 putative ATPase [Natronoflexus pectinivorans]
MIDYIEIKGFKSIKHLELELKPINVFIGSNGSGKSNFISFFKMVYAIFNRQLQRYVIEEKTDNVLYFGRKTTEAMFGKLIFAKDEMNNNAYWFSLAQTKEGGLYIADEASGYNISKNDNYAGYNISSNNDESIIPESNSFRNNYLKEYLSNIQIYHFHDTSATSMLRRECDINDNDALKTDGRNLPAFLYYLQEEHPKVFKRLEKTVKSIAPYIDRFILQPKKLNKNEIELRWVEKGDLDSNFNAYQFSDGTLRFIALATVLMQPEPPAVIVIDEPELGLHPQAIQKLAGLIKLASNKTQLIISTQSVNLVDCFETNDIVTVDRSTIENQSIFKRLDESKLKGWLEEHSLGELWERNIINSAQPFSK